MGMYDEVVAAITCPCCKRRYLDYGIQTKNFRCVLSKIFENDDTRNIVEERKSFGNIRNETFKCFTFCVMCSAGINMTGVISEYVFRGVKADSFNENIKRSGTDGIAIDPSIMTENGNHAAENGLLKP